MKKIDVIKTNIMHVYLKAGFFPDTKSKHACHRYGFDCDEPDDKSLEEEGGKNENN